MIRQASLEMYHQHQHEVIFAVSRLWPPRCLLLTAALCKTATSAKMPNPECSANKQAATGGDKKIFCATAVIFSVLLEIIPDLFGKQCLHCMNGWSTHLCKVCRLGWLEARASLRTLAKPPLQMNCWTYPQEKALKKT